MFWTVPALAEPDPIQTAKQFVAVLRKELARTRYQGNAISSVVEKAELRGEGGVDRGWINVEWYSTLGPSPALFASVRVDQERDPSAEGPHHVDGANIILWPTREGTDVQYLDGFRTWVWNVSNLEHPEVFRRGSRLTLCGAKADPKVRRLEWPTARVYRLRQGHWFLTSEVDDKPHEGWAEFKRTSGHVVGDKVISHNLDWSTHLSAPMSGPILRFDRTWYVEGDTIQWGARKPVHDAFAELDWLAQLAQRRRKGAFDKRVPRSCRLEAWSILRNQRNVSRDFSASDRDQDSRFEVGEKIFWFIERAGKWRLGGILGSRPFRGRT